jgi:hypothetical protein
MHIYTYRNCYPGEPRRTIRLYLRFAPTRGGDTGANEE